MEMIKEIELSGLIPVIKLERIEDALPLMGALTAAGLRICEVTFRTACAKEAITLISSKCSNMIVGAGTVITTSQVDDAIEAGAKFIVSPGFNPKVVDYCLSKQILIIPGCSTASNIEQALERNIKVVKFFPAEQSGGLNMIKALSGPYPSIKYMPTGGINASNLNTYLANPKVIACGGSYMVSDELIKEGRFDEITILTRNAINQMLALDLHHIAVNSTPTDGDNLLANFSSFLGLPFVGGGGAFAGGIIEIIKNPVRGVRGHIAFKTPNLERAIYYLEQRGFTVDPTSVIKDINNKITVAYFNQELGGFALHLMKA